MVTFTVCMGRGVGSEVKRDAWATAEGSFWTAARTAPPPGVVLSAIGRAVGGRGERGLWDQVGRTLESKKRRSNMK